MLIYTHSITSRCRYSFGLVFNMLLNGSYTLTDNMEEYLAYAGEKVAYTCERPPSGFFVQSAGLLFETGLRQHEPDVISFNGTKALFATGGDFPFDLFAASFYLVSRYEEYLPFVPDADGRYPHEVSLASRHGFLQTPVADVWAEAFKKELCLLYPSLSFTPRVFHSITSFDIDAAYAFAGRSWLYNGAVLGKWLLNGRLDDAQDRWKVIREKKADPYDTYAAIRGYLRQYETTPLFFFLLGLHRTRYDRNLSPSSGKLRRLIQDTALSSDLGIHPSYYSMDRPVLLHREKAALEKIVGRPVTKSRQHFLRFRLPHTYRHLLEAGITDDYSMGYAGMPGFRAGTCTPHYFYDLSREEITSLKIHPITYMEATFIQFLQTPPAKALDPIRELTLAVRSVQGTSLSIWHNETLSEAGAYKGWTSVLEESMRFTHQL